MKSLFLNHGEVNGFIAKYSDEPISVNEEPQTNHQIILSPDPANSSINIKANFNNASKTEFKIIDILGNEMMRFEDFDAGEINRDIDLSKLPTGVYFLKIIRNNEVIGKMFVKY